MIQAQFQKRVSIFQCDQYLVLSNGGTVLLGTEETVQIPAPSAVMGKVGKDGVTTSSWLNTQIFMEAWQLVLKDGRFRSHDWIVKVDVDAVFFPERLKDVLRDFWPGQNLYLNNCHKYGWDSMYGSLEVVSRAALEMYLAGWKKCKAGLKWHGWGEDLFLKSCLNMLGVGHSDRFKMLGDKRCHWAPCTDPSKIVYHDYKEIDAYFHCWAQSSIADQGASIAGAATSLSGTTVSTPHSPNRALPPPSEPVADAVLTQTTPANVVDYRQFLT
jgi:hypothetical protein